MFGLVTLALLLGQTGWQIGNTIAAGVFPDAWPFHADVLAQSSTWFYALVQVALSLQIGVGAVPVVTGKFLYKGDALRSCFVFVCFNLLVSIVAAAYYMTTFSAHNRSDAVRQPFPDLTTLTSIYDRAFVEEKDSPLRSLVPSLAYLMAVLAGLTSISIAVYSSSRLLKRHPSYVMCLGAMFSAIGALLWKDFLLARMLDLHWVGLAIVCALVFELVSIAWVYGAKDLAVDLEFSVGRPISRLWLALWSLLPLLLAGIVAWWIADPSPPQFDPVQNILTEWIPRWAPVLLCLTVIALFAVHEVAKQVDYNLLNMIQEATRPAKDWGPGDPLVRHAWKQWKSVCDDTGERDFTLRRRGTKDWTSSIKKGQYSHASRNQNNNHIGRLSANGKSATSITGGSNSPNYSGSVFGDSAIEEDMSSDKYPSNQLEPFAGHESRSHKSSTKRSSDTSQRSYLYHQQRLEQGFDDDDQLESNYHSQRIPIRISGGRREDNFTSRIEIFPEAPAHFQSQSTFQTRNPLSQHLGDLNFSGPFQDKFGQHLFQQDFRHLSSTRLNGAGHLINNIHIGDASEGSASTKTASTTHGPGEPRNWRKLNRSGDEFSTEL
jgi:solute carrier family 6 (neurotransmitter transporter), invertebrate